ncbi:c-type cytochrome [Solirhodobacter olei]|uniref:c-type cytochrome n=1 Tax=Solirhodobacter olei TaxID=2493082 RepID=UPI000FDC1762|nr:cytochrome c family protein [Solirhodobacter olei]
MFDTMTWTKIVGGFCGALLVFLLGNWAGEVIYAEHDTGGKPAYAIQVADAGGSSGTAAAKAPDFKTVLASADVKKGERIFNKCKACHRIDGKNATGPHLNGVVGRPVASISDFSYSDALKKKGGDWTPAALNVWLKSPKEDVPGTKMGFAGLPSVQDRADVIAYLATLK